MATWPNGPLGTKAEIYLGSWTDMTTYVYQRSPVQITRGRQNQSATMSPSQCTMTLNNRDSRFTIRNPLGAWYGQIGQNTPFRLSVPNSLVGGGTYLRMEDDTSSYASCPDSTGLQITGTLDVRIDLDPSGYGGQPAGSGAQSLIGKSGDTTDVGAWGLFLNPDGTLVLYWYDTGQAAQENAISTVPIPSLGRIALRAVLDTATKIVGFYTAPTISGTWTQLGNLVDITYGTVSLSPGVGIPVQVGYTNNPGVTGQVYAASIYSGIGGSGGTLVANPVFTSQTAGATSFTDGQGNTWTMNGTAELSNRLYRFHGELSSLPRAADPSATDVYSDATAFGIMQRLSQQQNPIQSAMYRAYVRLPSSDQLAAYWPMEDGTLATSLGSALPGGIPMSFTGTPKLSSNSDFVCSAALPVCGSNSVGATFTGVVPASANVTWTANVVRFLLEVPTNGDTNGGIIARIFTTGTTARIDLVYGTGGTLTLKGYDGSGASLWTGTTWSFNVNGAKFRVSVELNPTTATVVTVAPGATTGNQGPTSFAGLIGSVTWVELNPGALFTQTVFGHLSVQGFQDSVFDLGAPLNAWQGETAAARYARLCSEEGINCRVYGFPDDSAAMGYQAQQTLADLLKECETTDQGMMYEPRANLGLGYLTLAGLYNLGVTATASYSAAQLAAQFGPSTDNQLTTNDVTVTNADGSIARQVLESGPMSVQNPPAGIGRLDTQVSVNAAEDSQLASMANWMLWVRSVNDDRYPVIPFDMARTETPASIPLLDCGSYLQLTGTPAWVPPPPVRQLTAGFSERLGPAGVWQIDCNGIPEAPYEVAVANTAHADTGGSALAAAVTPTATTLSVATDGIVAGGFTPNGLAGSWALVFDEEFTGPAGPVNTNNWTVIPASENGTDMALNGSGQLVMSLPDALHSDELDLIPVELSLGMCTEAKINFPGATGGIAYRTTPAVFGSSGGSGTSWVVNKQTGTAPGDLIFIYIFCDGNSTTSMAITGFTVVDNASALGALFYRTADGTEGSTFTITGILSGQALSGVIATVKNATGIVTNTLSFATATSLGVTGVTLPSAGWVLWFAANENGFNGPGFAITPPSGYTSRATTGAQSANPAVMLADNESAPSGATGTLTGTVSTSATWSGVAVGIIPASLYNHATFWTSGPDWPDAGEIDVAEVQGYSGGGGALSFNYHDPANPSGTGGGAPAGTWQNSYHTYSVVRGPTSCQIYWDGTLVNSIATGDNGQPQTIRLTLTAQNPGINEVFGTGSNVLVDYVRVWAPAGTLPLWTTSAGDFPFDILCDGERMTVTNITGTTSPQTFTVTRSVNGVVKAHSAGVSLVLYNTPAAAL